MEERQREIELLKGEEEVRLGGRDREGGGRMSPLFLQSSGLNKPPRGVCMYQFPSQYPFVHLYTNIYIYIICVPYISKRKNNKLGP